MQETVFLALELLAQGMAGIFVVLGLIALLVSVIQRLESTSQRKK